MENGGDSKLKSHECIELSVIRMSGKRLRNTIGEYERNDWHLHTYQTAGMGADPMSYIVNHYLLFERDK